MRVGVVDYGMGNLASVSKAIEASGVSVAVTADPEALFETDVIVLPGVGNFEAGMHNLKRAKLADPIADWARAGNPLLGICLGMQLLFERSEEGGVDGLGILGGEVVRMSSLVKVPHMGWNSIDEGEGFFAPYRGTRFYFVHSYACVPDDELESATCQYGDEVVAGVRAGAILGFQFHPEKSSTDGLSILAAGLKEVAA